MNHQEDFEPDNPRHERAGGHQRQVGPVNGPPLPSRQPPVVESEPLKDDEIEERSDSKQDERMPVQSVLPPPQSRKRAVFSNGEHVHIAATATVEITGGRV